jgi:hypothetical protein
VTPRRRLATFGARGALVRLFLEERRGVKRYVVQWGAKGGRNQESFPATKEGKAEAEAFFRAFGTEAEAQKKGERAAAHQPRSCGAPTRTPKASTWRPRTRAAVLATRGGRGSSTPAPTTWRRNDDPADHGFRKALDGSRPRDGDRPEHHPERPHRLQLGRAHGAARAQPLAPVRPQDLEGEADQAARRVSVGRVPGDLGGARSLTSARQWRPWVAVGLLGIYGNRQT